MGRRQQSHPKGAPKVPSAVRAMVVAGLRLSGSSQKGVHLKPRAIKELRPTKDALQGLRHAVRLVQFSGCFLSRVTNTGVP